MMGFEVRYQGQTLATVPGEVVGFVHPGVVYTQAEIDAWSTSSPEYTRLASTSAASLSKVPWVYGTQINSGGNANCSNCDLNTGFRDQSQAVKVQAVLWAADGNQARRDKVAAFLNEFRSVTSFEFDSVRQYKLVSGWAVTNLVQAAEIVGYHDPQFDRFLHDVCYPTMDWPENPNWHASFADSKLAIAAYLEDDELWADAKRYLYERIGQSIYHPSHDAGSRPVPMHNEDNPEAPRLHPPPGTPSVGRTQAHWGKQYDPAGIGQVRSDLTLNPAFPIVSGMNAERLRDLGHVNMGLGAWMHGLRTLRAQGEGSTPEYQQAYARLLAGYDDQGRRVLHYAQTGNFLAPAPANGDGGGSRFQAWYGARKLFGAQTPQPVLDMLARSEVKTYPAAGANHLVAEAFADA